MLVYMYYKLYKKRTCKLFQEITCKTPLHWKINWKQCCPKVCSAVVDMGTILHQNFFVEVEGNQKGPKRSTTMLDWMKCNIRSEVGKREQVFLRWKEKKWNVGFGAVGESNFGIEIKRNQTHVDGVWFLTNLLTILWRIWLGSQKKGLFKMEEKGGRYQMINTDKCMNEWMIQLPEEVGSSEKSGNSSGGSP